MNVGNYKRIEWDKFVVMVHDSLDDLIPSVDRVTVLELINTWGNGRRYWKQLEFPNQWALHCKGTLSAHLTFRDKKISFISILKQDGIRELSVKAL